MIDTDHLYLYHASERANLAAIYRDGIEPSDSDGGIRGAVEGDLEARAAEEGIQLPIDRRRCVFCYPSLRVGIEHSEFDTGRPGSTSFFDGQGLAVVDAEALRDDLYVADFQLFSEAIDLCFMPEPDDIIRSDSYDDALTNYLTSVTKLTAFESLRTLTERYRIPEVLIEGGVPGDRIVEVVFLKEVLGTGSYASDPALPSA